MKLKEGVSLDGVRLPMLRALPIIEEVSLEVLGRETIVTATTRDDEDSLHEGLAIDVRSHDVSELVGDVYAARIRRRLLEDVGPGYDVLQHGRGDDRHVHTEFDPR